MSLYKWVTSAKYRFFYQKIREVKKSLWELDFKVSKARAMREQSRQARDRAVEQVQLVKAQPVPQDETAVKAQATQLEQAEAQVKGFEAQMQMIDEQINGSKDDAGTKGLMEYMAGLAELRAMYIDYASKI